MVAELPRISILVWIASADSRSKDCADEAIVILPRDRAPVMTLSPNMAAWSISARTILQRPAGRSLQAQGVYQVECDETVESVSVA